MNQINPKISKQIEDTIIFLVNKYSKTGYNTKPVIFHSLSLAFYLLNYKYNVEIIQVAILHDLVEDSRVTISSIEKYFGKKIAKLVSSLTFNKKIKNKENRYKELFFRTISVGGKSASIVKCADTYNNSFYIELVNDKDNEIFLVNKIKYFLNISKNIIFNEPVWKDLNKRLKEEKQRIKIKYNINI